MLIYVLYWNKNYFHQYFIVDRTWIHILPRLGKKGCQEHDSLNSLGHQTVAQIGWYQGLEMGAAVEVSNHTTLSQVIGTKQCV